MVSAGMSAGRTVDSMGTVTCLLSVSDDPNTIFLMSAAHVLATPLGVPYRPAIGDPIVDSTGATVARLSAWTDFGDDANTADAAIAQLELGIPADAGIGDRPLIRGLWDLTELYAAVTQYGAVSCAAGPPPRGSVRNLSYAWGVDTQGAAGVGHTNFEPMGLSDVASEAGDSGAPVLDDSGYLVGMLLGGCPNGTVFGPIGAAINALSGKLGRALVLLAPLPAAAPVVPAQPAAAPAALAPIGRSLPNDPASVRDVQRKLRALGYLPAGIDGVFGNVTNAGVRALQYDLLNNSGASTQNDGQAPVSLTEFNHAPGGGQIIAAVTGVVDAALMGCIDALMADPRVPKLPSSNEAVSANKQALDAVSAVSFQTVPRPFLLSILKQESGWRQFAVPAGADEDSFVVVGLDRAGADKSTALPDWISSRGYGIGQYTLFHHPPTAEEIASFIADPVQNIRQAESTLQQKFSDYVAGNLDYADDRRAEQPTRTLTLCKYSVGDLRRLTDCVACARAAGTVTIVAGTPLYPGSSQSYQPTRGYPSADYGAVPDRAGFPCDWPYAARRYNGSGLMSYHYQVRILQGLLALPS